MTECLSLLFLVLVGLLAVLAEASSALKGVEFFGRFREENGKRRADWPGSGARLSYTPLQGSLPVTLNVTFTDCGSCNFFVSVYHNCEQGEKFNINQDQLSFTYTLKPSDRLNEVSMMKVTEASYTEAVGIFELESVKVENAIVTPTFKPQCTQGKRLLFIGDSFTCAFGVDEADPCPFTAFSEDVTHGYAFVLGRMFKADVHTIAWSGKGVVRNYGDVNQLSEVPMPSYYNRTLATISSVADIANYWDPKRYIPDVVTVLLGTNVYSTQPEPTDEQFISGLTNLAILIHQDYPSAKVLLACSPALTALQCNNVAQAADNTNSAYVQIPPSVFIGGYGCSGHPSKQTQQYMAEAVQPAMAELLGEI